MSLRPLGEKVLVKRAEAEGQTESGIFLPESAKEKPQEAEVVAVGPGSLDDGKRVPPEVKEGDKVLIGKYSGTEVKIEGEEYLIIREDELLAIVG